MNKTRSPLFVTKVLGLIGGLSLALFFAACAEAPLTPPDPSLVQEHTGGYISRESTIQVVFTDEDLTRLPGEKLSGEIFKLSPALDGVTVWKDQRTLEFIPSSPLPRGGRFRATVNLPQVPPFDFLFQVKEPHFDISLDSLQALRETGQYKLSGKIVTADREKAEDVTRLLKAQQGGRNLEMEWSHGADSHSFSILGVRREEQATELVIQWEGSPLGASVRGEKKIPVPSLKDFVYLDARVSDRGDNFVEIAFSDRLDPRQSFSSYVSVEGRSDVQFQSEGNRLFVYASAPWKAVENIQMVPGLKNDRGMRLQAGQSVTVAVPSTLPQVRLPGKGIILPSTQGLTIPVETVNVRALIVEAFQVYGDNMLQHLQVNNLDQTKELHRVGKVVWRKVVTLPWDGSKVNEWVRSGLDLSPLVKNFPDGMFQLRVSFRMPHVVWDGIPADFRGQTADPVPLVVDGPEKPKDLSYWDYYEDYYGNNESSYSNRSNPAYPEYYQYGSNVLARRLVLISDIGIQVKGDPFGGWTAAVSNLKTAAPLPGALITFYNFQRRVMGKVTADAQGLGSLNLSETPAFAVAEKDNQKAYLQLDDQRSLVVSQFDLAGDRIDSGIKGFTYAERSIWRPGDTIYLNFILQDPLKKVPANHPVTVDLRDPKGQITLRQTQTASVGGFYHFELSTAPSAPTGDWSAEVRAGGQIFRHRVKVETVMPNRLKMLFEPGTVNKPLSQGEFTSLLEARWLHGSPGSLLKADVTVNYSPTTTTFPAFDDFTFHDLTNSFSSESQTIYSGTLDKDGKTNVEGNISVSSQAPGKLIGHFTVRVFENSGVFSSEQFSKEVSPYDSYVGLKLPKGDEARGMLLTDVDHPVSLALLDGEGKALNGDVEVSLYKIQWRWWWESQNTGLPSFSYDNYYNPLLSGRVSVKNGRGQWIMNLKYPEWGRYLVRAKDLNSGHTASKIVYMDWPGWAGRAAAEGQGGAAILTMTADKKSYTTGETVSVTLPTNPQGRILAVLEKGGKVIRSEWIQGRDKSTVYTFKATPEMAPNVYVHMTFIQPHLQTQNNLPIRLYGSIPVSVVSPESILEPEILSAPTLEPNSKVSVQVREKNGRPMTYTLAVVDEGLLTINRYRTPNPWNVFFAREASALKHWDIYDWVAGAWSGKLETLLAIGGGGDDGEGALAGGKKVNRFPPVVKFFTPRTLKAGETQTLGFDMPLYTGAVRFMVVAGNGTGFGTAEKEVPVKTTIMAFATAPRVLTVSEEVDIPVTVFNTNRNLRTVRVSLQTEGSVAVLGESTRTLTYDGEGDKDVKFRVKVQDLPGAAVLKIRAEGGSFSSQQVIEISVRNPNPPKTAQWSNYLNPGQEWKESIVFPGIAGTNSTEVEISRIPPLNLSKNLEYLIQYPHGCLEQTTSSAFPQIYLDKLVAWPQTRIAEIQTNIAGGVTRLRSFQVASGGFSYWPGEGTAHEWGSNYAGHFLVLAQKRGFAMPPNMIENWIGYQRNRASVWTPNSGDGLNQAYRLYTLALAGRPELPAMNRLRDHDQSTEVVWRLAAAYLLAGQETEARKLIAGLSMKVRNYQESSGTFGSGLRDKAMILETLVLFKDWSRAAEVSKEISTELSNQLYQNTQTTSYSLVALAHFGLDSTPLPISATLVWNNGTPQQIKSATGLWQGPLESIKTPVAAPLSVKNTSGVPLYIRVLSRGLPSVTQVQTAESKGLSLSVAYYDENHNVIDPKKGIAQGSNVFIKMRVTNLTRTKVENVALSHMVPGNWEIRNDRIGGSARDESESSYDFRDIRDDRVYTYFTLESGESKNFQTKVTVAYSGTFYLPSVSAEAMYDPATRAVVPGYFLLDIKDPAANIPDHLRRSWGQ